MLSNSMWAQSAKSRMWKISHGKRPGFLVSHINRKQKKNEGESYSTLKEKMRDNSQM